MIKEPRKNGSEELDQHNQPTEPMPRIDASAFDPTIPSGPDHLVLPAPPNYQEPLEQQSAQGKPYSALSPAQTYPVLPPSPANRPKGRPAGGVGPMQPGKARQPARLVGRRRSPIPALVGMIFVALQLLLLLRFVLKIANLHLSAYQVWIGNVYGLSEPLVAPFRTFWQQLPIQMPLQIPFAVEVYTLLAILAYGLLSRILVHLLKAILNAR